MNMGVCGDTLSWDTAPHAGRRRICFPMVSLGFFNLILPAVLWPWGRLSH